MNPPLTPLHLDILAVLADAGGPVSTTDVRNQLNTHRSCAVVAEQVYKALRTLQRRSLVRRARVPQSRNAYWHAAIESQKEVG